MKLFTPEDFDNIKLKAADDIAFMFAYTANKKLTKWLKDTPVLKIYTALLEAREGLRQLDDFRVCNSPGRAIATNIIANIDKVLGEK